MVRTRVWEITRQVCEELGVTIISRVLSTDHVHTFVSIPPHRAMSDVMMTESGEELKLVGG